MLVELAMIRGLGTETLISEQIIDITVCTSAPFSGLVLSLASRCVLNHCAGLLSNKWFS